MKLEYTDLFKNKYRYGTLYPNGENLGTKINEKLVKSRNWKLINNKRNCEDKGDNRMDRYYGFNSEYLHTPTNKTLFVFNDTSATGKTVQWKFISNDIKDKEEFSQLLRMKI